MPAPTERAYSFLDALLGEPASADQRTRLIAAYAPLAMPEATDEQIALVLLGEHHRRMTDQINFTETAAASAGTKAKVAEDFAPVPPPVLAIDQPPPETP